MQVAKQRLDWAVNPNLMTPGEWRHKLVQPDSFVARLQEKPRLFVIGMPCLHAILS